MLPILCSNNHLIYTVFILDTWVKKLIKSLFVCLVIDRFAPSLLDHLWRLLSYPSCFCLVCWRWRWVVKKTGICIPTVGSPTQPTCRNHQRAVRLCRKSRKELCCRAITFLTPKQLPSKTDDRSGWAVFTPRRTNMIRRVESLRNIRTYWAEITTITNISMRLLNWYV